MLSSEISFLELDHTMLGGPMGQALTNLWNQFNSENIDNDTLAIRFHRAKVAAIVAVDVSQEVLGFVSFSRLKTPMTRVDYVEVWALFVLPSVRMQGIGAALITQVERCADTCSVSTRFFVSASEAQVPFYQKCGYELNGSVRMTRECPAYVLDTKQ